MIQCKDDDFIRFATNGNTEHMRIKSDGNVGIGTIAPTGKLQVHNDGSGIKVLNENVTGQVFEVYGDNGSLLTVSDDLSDSLLRVNDAAGLPVFEVFANDTVIAGQYGQNDLVVSGNKVGVGTSAPASELSVNGGVSVGDTYTTTAAPADGAIIVGHVGIGTNNPDYRLTVDAGTTNEIARFRSTDNDALISISDNTDAVYVGLDASADIMSLGFSNSFASTNLSIDTIGNVGIGTTNPSSNVHVSYSSGVTDIKAGFLSGTAGPGIRGQNTSTTANTYFPIDFRCSDADARIAFQYSGTTNQGQLLFITEAHSTSPKLGIYDRGTVARVLVNDTTSTGTPTKTFEVKYVSTSTDVTQEGLQWRWSR